MTNDFEGLFERAKALPPERRSQFLRESCGDDSAMREQIERKLAETPVRNAVSEREEPVAGDEVSTLTLDEDQSAGQTFLPGTVLLDRYRIVSRLGSGDMGQVYRADDLKLRQKVALKFLPEGLPQRLDLSEALYNEVRRSRSAAHRHLGRVFDIGEWEGRPFLSMEFIEGEDLRALLRRIGALPLKKAVDLGLQLCAGLQEAHEAGLVHLDLKPANLMIDERGDLRIIDFCLARLVSEVSVGHHRAGTPAYMAPEHLLRGEVSVRCDIYAAGLVLAEMMTGVQLHRGRSPIEIMAWHESGMIPEFPGLPADMNELILECLSRKPEERPQSAAMLGEVLDGISRRLGSPAAQPDVAVATGSKQLAALMFTDLVDSVGLQDRLGTESYMHYVARHDEIFQECLAAVPSAEILNETGDGFLVRFADPTDAVTTALRLQHRLHGEVCQGERIRLRVGLHVGVVTQMEERIRGERRAVGMPINLTARLMDLADGGQILMTRGVYEDARNYVRRHPCVESDTPGMALKWVSHGYYGFKGNPEPMEVFEVGVEGIASFVAPEDGRKATRVGASPFPAGQAVAADLVVSPDALKDSDVMIAYAPVDDRSITPGKTGWIRQFHDHLEVRLEQLSGEPVKIWRDAAGRAGDPPEEVLALLPNARTMVSVVSPPFVKTPGCLREFEEFWHKAEREGNLRVSNKLRMLKVVKTPVPPGIAPPEFDRLCAQLPGFEFFELDPETGRHWEYDDTFGQKAKERYFERIYDLAYEIRDILQALRAGKSERHDRRGEHRLTVFLAETTSDLQAERDHLKRELLECGHRVVPELPLPLIGPEFEREVRLLLEQSDFAVHLVGARYGLVPEDTAGSVVELQNRLASEAAGARELERLIWLPRDVQPRDERQAAFLKALIEDPEAHRGGEVVRDSMENFKALLLERLAPPPLAPSMIPAVTVNADGTPGGPITVYLIYDQRDEEEVETLEDLLFDLGFEVATPHFEGDEAEIGKIHRHNLQHCDAALVYYGSAGRPWVEMKLMDLMQAPGYGRTRELLAKSVFIAPSTDRRKARFRTHLADVIRAETDRIDASVLEPFTLRLQRDAAS